MQQRIIVLLVLASVASVAGVLAVAAVTLTVLERIGITDEDDYAELVPAPNSVEWRVDQERTVWLDSNLRAVDLRIDSIDLGVGGIQRLEHGEMVTLGRATGCIDAVVAGVDITEIDENSGRATFRVNYGSLSSGTALTLYHRRYREGRTPRQATVRTIDLTVPASGQLTASYDYTGLDAGGTGGRHYVEASLNEHFPHDTTRVVSFMPTDGADDVSVTGEEDFHLVHGTGIGLVGCDEHEDALVSLHAVDGTELNRYYVDVLSAPAATPLPATPVPPPVFDPPYRTLRFCPGDTTDRASYLTGDEAVGMASATGTGTITHSLAPDGASRDYAFFAISSAGAVTVSDAGADDHTGIDGTRLYTFAVLATDDAGRRGEALVVVQLDLATLSPNEDGACS